MASLKDLKSSIFSVQSTKRITSAMKMVAAAKLKRATDNVEASRPYSNEMGAMLANLANGSSSTHPLLAGTGNDQTHLFVVISSDRGLCGGFNGNLVRKVSVELRALKESGKSVKLIIVGRKASVGLRREFSEDIIESFEDLNKPAPDYSHALTVSNKITELLNNNSFDVCTMYYNIFVNALEQTPTPKQIIPMAFSSEENNSVSSGNAVYEYEPSEDAILSALLPKNLTVQIYSAMLESFAGEQAARMSAMDNATTNAGDMIRELQIKYNRSRQAQITNELIEIISGAEAL